MKISFTLLIIICTILYFGCSSDSNKSTIFNPNGSSELALLMRDMYDDGLVTKQQIIDGKEPEVKVDYHKIHTAKPTEEGKNTTESYVGFAKAYEEAVDKLLSSEASMRGASYQYMINTCMNCHSEVCPGPKVKIKKLYLSEDQLASLK